VKAANIRCDPRAAICVDDDKPPFSCVIIEGTASLSDNREELRYWVTRIGAATWEKSLLRRTVSVTALKVSCS
jgi:general stress protein 26